MSSGHIAKLREFWDDTAQGPDRQSLISTASDYDASGAASCERVMELIPPAEICLFEMGCGDGRVTRHLAQHYAAVIAADVSFEMLQHVKDRDLDNVQCFLTSGTESPGVFSDRLLDRDPIEALCSDSVLMHNTKADVAIIMRNLSENVAPGTPFALHLPIYEVGPHEATSPIDVGIWTEDEFFALCLDTGWSVERLRLNEGCFSWDAPGPLHGEMHLLRAT